MSDTHDDDNYEDPHPSVTMPDSALVRVKKGEEINITRLDPTIRDITAGVGWDLKKLDGEPIDVDVSIFLLDKNDNTRQDDDFIFYNSLTGRDGAVKHLGDSRTGAGDGDDEKIVIDLLGLSFDITKVMFVLSIYDLDMNPNNFSLVKNVFFRLTNNETGLEIFRFELDDDMGMGTGLLIGYLERVGSDWMYKALGEPVMGGLSKIATDYGVVVLQNVRS